MYKYRRNTKKKQNILQIFKNYKKKIFEKYYDKIIYLITLHDK